MKIEKRDNRHSEVRQKSRRWGENPKVNTEGGKYKRSTGR